MHYETNANCSVDSRSDEIGNESLKVAQQCKDRQRLLDSTTVSMAPTSIDDCSEDSDIYMLLLAASQQFELQSESHQLSFLQQASDWALDEYTALVIKKIKSMTSCFWQNRNSLKINCTVHSQDNQLKQHTKWKV